MNKRDDIQAAIEVGINRSGVLDVEENTAAITKVRNCVMEQLDSLVERWTDEETAEDLSKVISPEDVYIGMRVRIVKEEPGSNPKRPVGATGTIIKDDGDSSPGVHFDPPNGHLNELDMPGYSKSYLYTNLDKMEKLEE